MRRGWKLAFVVGFAMAVLGTSAAQAAAPGGITQLAAPDGCVTNDGSGGSCVTGHDMGFGESVLVSPDGRNVYVPDLATHGLLTFDRNATGALIQKPGPLGCTHLGAATASCGQTLGLNGPIGLAMTPDGRTLYVASTHSDAVLVFDRDADTGVLTKKSGISGCIANTASATCSDARAMDGASFFWMSPDARFLYVVSQGPGHSVTALKIEADGTLSQVTDGPGGSGCVENVPSADGCADGRAMGIPFSITGAADGQTIYVAGFSDNSVSALTRDATFGRLAPLGGASGCVDAEGTDACAIVTDLDDPRGVAVSPNGEHVYATSHSASKVILFDRLPSGGLVRRAGVGGCLAEVADAGCRAGRGLTGASGITISADGGDVYVASRGANAGLVELDRAADGVLAPRPGTDGCIVSAPAPADCAPATVISGMSGLALSPDERNLYVMSADSPELGIFRRDSAGPTCADGAATVQQGTVTTLALPCADVDGDPVDTEIVSPPTLGALGAIDQGPDQVNFAAPQGQCGSTTFSYRGSSGGQTSATGVFALAVEGCATTLPPPPTTNAGCEAAKRKLEKAKKKLKKLKQNDAKPVKIKKAKKKVRDRKRKVKEACA